jgi:hypothetical protein
MSTLTLFSSVLLTLVLFAYTFWPERNPLAQTAKTRLEFLLERKTQVYENLRDLNFEFRSGKYPEVEYGEQRTILEQEAALLLAEIEVLQTVR